MKRSIYFKNFLATAFMFVACFLIFGITMLFMVQAFLMRERRDSLYANAQEVKRYAEAVRLQGGLSSWELRMNITSISISTGNHILVCDGEGEILASSDAVPVSPYAGRRIEQAILRQMDGQEGFGAMSTLGGVYDSPRYTVGEKVEGWNGRVAGYVLVSYELTGLFRMWRGFLTAFILIAIGVLAFAIFVTYLNTRRMTRPLYEMSEAADRFAHGDYSARVRPTGREDEIGTLLDAFNGMAGALEQNEARRREFVANISHELRTPMTTIAGFADGILDGTIPREQEQKYLEAISSETKRLNRLVRSMLDMSRLRDGAPEKREGRFDLSEMVVRTVLNFEERVDEKQLQMELDLPEDPLFVKGDVDALTRVVYNLMDNAVKFSREGGALSVSLWKENGRAYVCVQDEGAVIPPEELGRVFDRFHKTDRSRSRDRDGVGLGLYMVREILAAHHQDIFVTSADGRTAFTFTLALAGEE